jgi:hypothetical protein
MSERLSSSYRQLFQVHILHHYWLDDGNVLFDTLPKDALKRDELNLPKLTPTREQHLRSYDVRQFLTITPTQTSAKYLSGFGCIFKNTALGFVVLAPNSSLLPQDLQFEFVLTVKNPDFFNYTALTIRPQPITELYQQAENKTYRYKNNVPVLSNLTGVFKTEGLNKSLYLSKAFPALSADDPVEALVQIGNALVQLTSDQPGAGQQQINAQVSKMPVFVNQGDVAADGILLEDIPDDIFALIRLAAVREDNDEFSFITAAGQAKTPAPVFQIRFKNRSTRWYYYHANSGKNAPPFFVEPDPLPLTFFGNASSASPKKKQKPSHGFVIPQIDNSVQPKVLGLNSEIFE